MNNLEYFFCYNDELAKFLRYENDFKFITKALHPGTRNQFYLFEHTSQLNEAINEFNKVTN